MGYCLFNSNTSHVTINLKQISGLGEKIRIQIHLMLLLILTIMFSPKVSNTYSNTSHVTINQPHN